MATVLEHVEESTHTSPLLTLRDTCSEFISLMLRVLPSDKVPDVSATGMAATDSEIEGRRNGGPYRAWSVDGIGMLVGGIPLP
jgi:hypothetical protein